MRPGSAADRLTRLSSFVNAAAETPTVIGESDCCTWPVQWIKSETGRSVRLPRYSTWDDAEQIVRNAGGLVALVTPLLASVGVMPAYGSPMPGDVAVVSLRHGEVGAIVCHGDVVAIRGRDCGVYFMAPAPSRLLQAWHV